MIRKRIPRKDDRTIVDLVKRELFPFTRRAFPGIRWEPGDVRRKLAGNVTLVAVSGRAGAVGFISAKVNGQELFLDMLAVDRSRQGRGLGAALMKEAERYGLAQGCRTARLFVDETNEKARSFYWKLGYAEKGYHPAFRCIEMGKTF